MEQINFFNRKDIDLFARVFGEPYRSNVLQDKKKDDDIKNGVWKKTEHWYNEVLLKLEGFNGKFESKRLTLGRAKGENGKEYRQFFKGYTWARIFREGDKDRYIYFTVGVDAEDKSLVYKLDCQHEGKTPLTPDQIDYFNELIKDSPAKWMSINNKDLVNYSWDILIKETVQFIQKYLGLYDEIVRKIWNIDGYSIPDLEIKEYKDGKIREELRNHKWRERNFKLVADYKKNHNNVKNCPGCTFNPKGLYNIDAIDFLELHHIIPLSKKNPNDKITFNDLTLLCPNCHRAIHKMMVEDDHNIISLNDFKRRLKKNYD